MIENLQEHYCRWAEDYYGLDDVTSVRFETGWYQGCPTCGDSGAEVEVYIKYGVGKSTIHTENFDTDLLNSILKGKRHYDED